MARLTGNTHTVHVCVCSLSSTNVHQVHKENQKQISNAGPEKSDNYIQRYEPCELSMN